MDDPSSQQADMLMELINSYAVWHGETDEASTMELRATDPEMDVSDIAHEKEVSKDDLRSLNQNIEASLDRILAAVTACNQISCQPLNFEGPQ